MEFADISAAGVSELLDALRDPSRGLRVAPSDGRQVGLRLGPPDDFHRQRPSS